MSRKTLVELLHEILPEPPEEETRSRWRDGERRRCQFEETEDGTTETYRYDPIFTNEKFDMDHEIDAPHNGDWPGLNLYVEKGLASIIEQIHGLEGKTVVSFRPEYYPFFGLQAAKKGAKSILVDGRTIPTVEDLVNNNLQYSHELAKEGEQKWREGVGREEVIATENRALLASSKLELISTVVRDRQKISPEVWDNLTDFEKSYYVFEWIDENPSFSLAVNKYFGGSASLFSQEPNRFYEIPENQRFPFVLKFLEENFDQLMSNETWYVARNLVSDKVRNTLSDNEFFSGAIEDIYFKLVGYKFMKSRTKPTDTQVQEAIVETLFQSKNPEDHDRIRTNMDYRYGKELGQAEILDRGADILFSGWGLDYLENSVDFVANAARILKEDGLFVGYVKKEHSGQSCKRNLTKPDYLRETLQKCGFEETVIVHKKEFEGITRIKDIGYVFFARKSDNSIPLETGLIPTTDIPNSGLFPKAQKEEVPITPAIQRRPVTKRWEQDVNLDSLVESFGSNDVSLVSNSLYGSKIASPNRDDLKNIIRGLYCQYGDVDSITENVQGLSESFQTTLIQYSLKQQQVELLLEDLNEAFTRINRFEDTTDVEQAIVERAATLGDGKISDYLNKVKDVLATTKLSPEVQTDLDKAQEKVRTSLREAYENHSNPHEWHYERAFKDNEIFFTSIERRKQLNEVVKALNDYFFDFDYSFHMNLDSKSTIQTSIGRIHKVATYDYFDKKHQVLFVDQTISMMDEKIQALYTEAVEGTPERKYVFLDRINDSTKKFVEGMKKRDDLPTLVRKQWGGLEDPKQVVRDIAHHASIHEIQHAYGTGELGSYLAELAFGETPYYDLFTKTSMLFELADDKHMGGLIASVMRAMGKISESEHLQAATALLPHYLDAAVESGKLSVVLEEKICSVYDKNAAGHLSLDKEKALRENKAVMEALTYLDASEIRNIATGLMQNRFGMTFENYPKELTANTPLIVNGTLEEEIKPHNLALIEVSYDTPKSVTLALRKAAYIEDPLTQSHQISDLATIVGDSDIDQALDLARTIKQRFPRERALVNVACQAAEKGCPAKATTILREAEASINEIKKGVGENFNFFSKLGDSFLMYQELVELKNRLGLQDESYELLTTIEKQFLDQDIDDISWKEYRILLDVAKRKDLIGYREEAISLIATVEGLIDQNTSQFFKKERAMLETTLTREEITRDGLNRQKISEYMSDEDWHNGSDDFKRTIKSLYELGYKDEILAETDRRIQAIERGDWTGITDSFVYNNLANALYKVGEKGRANELWVKAHQEDLATVERQETYDWGFEAQAETMAQYSEHRDEAVKIAMHIQDFPKRGQILAHIGQQYISSNETEKGLAVLGRAEQYLNDESQKSNLRLRIKNVVEEKLKGKISE
jgi:hypothetical protein